jgi:Beta-galactosidase/beta-glucuronidase
MKKALNTLMAFAMVLLTISCTAKTEQGIVIKEKNGKYELFIDGVPTYINGVGGTNRLDIAADNGANAFRTWGGSVENIKRQIELAKQYNMYIMQGIGMTKDSASYFDEAYKERIRAEVKTLAETFKDDPNILVWGIGNEIDLGNANIPEAWKFVNELAEIIKSIDKKHLVSTIIAHSKKALDLIGEHAPALDVLGINSYGAINGVEKMVNESKYNGAYFITEWGPTGHWEMPKTSWRAPIEQTSEEKRIVYEDRYNKSIGGANACLGSFVFLWGQKEERTPTWYSMFVESNVEGMPLKGEKTPQVEAMQRVWTKKELTQTAPVIHKFTIDGKQAAESITMPKGKAFTANVDVTDKQGDKLTYVWEILHEATVLGFGGSREPRPDRYGEAITADNNSQTFTISEAGQFRVYIYVLDNTGFVATANIPVLIE